MGQPIYPVKITILKKITMGDIFDKYAAEDHESECPMFKVGDEFIAMEDFVPEGFCRWAWDDIFKGIIHLSYGGDFPHIKQKGVMISCCTSGTRPVIFKLERIQE